MMSHYVSLYSTAAGYRVHHTSCDLTYRICSNINLLSRSLYVPLWVESILLMSSILIVIAASIMIGGLYLQFYRFESAIQYLKWTNSHRNTLAGSKSELSDCVHEQRFRSLMNTADAMRALLPENMKDT